MQPKLRAAFFDVDNTLLNLKSMFSFQQYFYEHAAAPWGGDAGAYARFTAQLQAHPQRHDRLALNRCFYESYRGWRHADVLALAERWFAHIARTHGERLWIEAALALARRLGGQGYLLVAVSGSSHEVLAPVLRHLRFDACLATTLERDGAVYTGGIVPPQVIGQGKADALHRFARERGIDLHDCVACGDHITDLPMLEAVGQSYVVAGDAALEAIALARNWPLLATSAQALEGQLAHV